jgi:cytochrome c peroxidase
MKRSARAILGVSAAIALTSCGLQQHVVSHRVNESASLVELGERLFDDNTLSASKSVSCSTCHKAELAFAESRAVSIGHQNLVGTRNAPSLIYAAHNRTQLWDGRRTTLEQQVLAPFVNTHEHGFADLAQLVREVNATAHYRLKFQRSFGDAEASEKTIAAALSAFIRSLPTYSSRFDRYRRGENTMSAEAHRGYALFVGRAQCAQCHIIDENASFTDNDYHATTAFKKPDATRSLAETARFVMSLNATQLEIEITSNPEIAELGRYVVTKEPTKIGSFKTPGLRNVAVTAPYMHDGRIASLSDAIDQEAYYRGLSNGRPLLLTPSEKADLLAFLQALTDERFVRSLPR